MLRWALIFLVVALIAALFGFGGIASSAAGIAKDPVVRFLWVFLPPDGPGSLARLVAGPLGGWQEEAPHPGGGGRRFVGVGFADHPGPGFLRARHSRL